MKVERVFEPRQCDQGSDTIQGSSIITGTVSYEWLMKKRTPKIHNGLVIEWKLWLPTSPVLRLSLVLTNNINIGTREKPGNEASCLLYTRYPR